MLCFSATKISSVLMFILAKEEKHFSFVRISTLSENSPRFKLWISIKIKIDLEWWLECVTLAARQPFISTTKASFYLSN